MTQVLKLQWKNLPDNLSALEIQSQGFVTLKHNLIKLQDIAGDEKHILAIDAKRVVGYALVMMKELIEVMPVLASMKKNILKTSYNGLPLSQSSYVIMGQICVAKSYRGKGVFDDLYKTYKTHLNSKYDYVITEVDLKNQRSLNAHFRVGFIEVSRYSDAPDRCWVLLLWDIR